MKKPDPEAYFKDGLNAENVLSNIRKQYIEFFHFPSSTSVRFKAFMTEWTDSFSSKWNETEVFGRMDPIQIFQGTSRKIAIGWEIVAGDAGEGYANMVKLQKLFKMLYPAYKQANNANSMSQSPLMRMTFMSWAGSSDQWFTGYSAKKRGLIGVVDGFQFAPILDEGVIERKVKGMIYPQAMTVSCNFSVLHAHPLGWDQDGNERHGFNNFPFALADPAAKNRKKKAVSLGRLRGAGEKEQRLVKRLGGADKLDKVQKRMLRKQQAIRQKKIKKLTKK